MVFVILFNKTKETLVPSAARNSRAQGKDYRMLEVISLSIALKLAIEILISKTNGQISWANAMSITMAKDLDQTMMKDLKT